jgi:hypothetical protein
LLACWDDEWNENGLSVRSIECGTESLRARSVAMNFGGCVTANHHGLRRLCVAARKSVHVTKMCRETSASDCFLTDLSANDRCSIACRANASGCCLSCCVRNGTGCDCRWMRFCGWYYATACRYGVSSFDARFRDASAHLSLRGLRAC